MMKRFPSLASTLAVAVVVLLAPTAAALAAEPPAPEPSSSADVETKVYPYKIGNDDYEGYLARPAKTTAGALLPGVLVVHDWTGCGPFAKARAEQLAKLGYVALAVDMYGKGNRADPKDPGSASKLASPFYKDFSMFRTRATAALEELVKQPGVDPKRLGAMGFCFGGTTVLELARSGADLKGVVSFHGGLKTPNGADSKNIKGQLLILHGSIDPSVPPADVGALMTDLNAAKVPYKFVAYPLTVHAFTNPDAGSDITKNAAYNPVAAEDAYGQMRRFFGELFAGAPAAKP